MYMRDDLKPPSTTQGQQLQLSPAMKRAVLLQKFALHLADDRKTLSDYNMTLTQEEQQLAYELTSAQDAPDSIQKELRTNTDELADRGAQGNKIPHLFCAMLPLMQDHRCLEKLLPPQRKIIEEFIEKMQENQQACIFIDAPGGLTYTLNTLLCLLRSQSHIVLAVASSGIAAILLILSPVRWYVVLFVLFHSILLTYARIHALATRATARLRPSPSPRHRSRRHARRVGSRSGFNW
eukprot:6192010-Pleurochrysis_carterae.AAC.2